MATADDRLGVGEASGPTGQCVGCGLGRTPMPLESPACKGGGPVRAGLTVVAGGPGPPGAPQARPMAWNVSSLGTMGVPECRAAGQTVVAGGREERPDHSTRSHGANRTLQMPQGWEPEDQCDGAWAMPLPF